MKRILFVFMVIFSILSNSAYAQQQTAKSDFRIYGLVALPLGDFGDDEGANEDGYAKMGFGIGAEYTLLITPPGLMWATSASVIVNGCDVSNVFDAEALGVWTNAPILTGLKYQAEISSKHDIYGLGQIGVNFIKPPSFEFSDGDRISYDMSTSFGFSIGGGVIMDNGINVGIQYFNLGKPEIKGSWEGSFDITFEEEQPVSIFVVTVGIPVSNFKD